MLQLEVNAAISSNPGEPLSLQAAIMHAEKEKWIEAIKKENNSFPTRNVWKKLSRTREVVNKQKKN
jgi:hypothetical protein